MHEHVDIRYIMRVHPIGTSVLLILVCDCVIDDDVTCVYRILNSTVKARLGYVYTPLSFAYPRTAEPARTSDAARGRRPTRGGASFSALPRESRATHHNPNPNPSRGSCSQRPPAARPGRYHLGVDARACE